MAKVLTDYLGNASLLRFEWGVSDCATFVLAWLDAQTGMAGRHAWAGRYHDEMSCEDFIAAGGGHAAIADDFLHRHYMIYRGMPGPGNPVLTNFKGRDAFGLRVDDRLIALRTEKGVLLTPRAEVKAEWRLR